MRHTAGFLALVLGLSSLPMARTADAAPREGSKIRYRAHSPAVFKEARRSGKPIFMVISAAWCGWCRQFEEKTLETDRVAAYLNANYLNVFVDPDRDAALAERYQRGLPMTVLFDPEGRVKESFVGVLTADDLLSVLESVAEAGKRPRAPARRARRHRPKAR